jgi:hypothetical protein
MVLCFRYNKRDIEYLVHFAESFSLEDLPIRDPDTGNLTMRGHVIPVNILMIFLAVFSATFHSIQCSIRIVSSHSMIFTTWYPFDASVSPVYEIVNFTQVLFVSFIKVFIVRNAQNEFITQC